eukprot:TRINITY_DN22422_c0_g1_i1.p1 TRINITY_DN22422_c0_g1~~TRINITY_DN22422_c0_g1_i1.p1  ORF type:complete len:408 (-),score=53.61 TRINITY_DN22422_c0_g1_i1:129-1352(-)
MHFTRLIRRAYVAVQELPNASDWYTLKAPARSPALNTAWATIKGRNSLPQSGLHADLAIQSNMLEGVFDLSRGVTNMLVESGYIGSHLLHTEDIVPLSTKQQIEAQLAGINYVMGLVRKPWREVTPFNLKLLHDVALQHQHSAIAKTPTGDLVAIPFVHGDYKRRPNNPLIGDDEVFEYCPPFITPAEIDMVFAQIHTSNLPDPEVTAAFLHHRLTTVHPFEDGNGRCARIFAALPLFKCALPAPIIRKDGKRIYLDALAQADNQSLQPFVEFITDRVAVAQLSGVHIALLNPLPTNCRNLLAELLPSGPLHILPELRALAAKISPATAVDPEAVLPAFFRVVECYKVEIAGMPFLVQRVMSTGQVEAVIAWRMTTFGGTVGHRLLVATNSLSDVPFAVEWFTSHSK